MEHSANPWLIHLFESHFSFLLPSGASRTNASQLLLEPAGDGTSRIASGATLGGLGVYLQVLGKILDHGRESSTSNNLPSPPR